jgi:hypothetical protein
MGARDRGIIDMFPRSMQSRDTVLAPVFAHPVSSRIRIVHVKIAKSLEKLRWSLLVCED